MGFPTLKHSGINKLLLHLFIFSVFLVTGCASSGNTTTVVKPRYHRTWYKNHVYKKKWQVWRIKFQPEKQGVKKVKMKG